MKIQYSGDLIHLDYITIPGARMKVLHHALMAEYSKVNLPIYVLLIGSLNDILKDQTSEEVMADIKLFRNFVMSLQGGMSNTFAIATLPSPP